MTVIHCHAHRPVRLRPAGGPHRLAAGSPARRGAASGGAAGGGALSWTTAASATCRICCGPATAWWSTTARSSRPGCTGRRIGRGATEPAIEATLHKRLDGSHWRAFVKLGAKKLEVGDTLRFGTEGKVCFLGELDAQVSHKDEGGEVTLSFSFHGPVLDQAIAERGEMPCRPISPPAARPTSRTAPTIRPFSPMTKARWRRRPPACISPTSCWRGCKARGIGLHKVTLHVGAGTFLPVKADDTEGHKMHAEFGTVSGRNGRRAQCRARQRRTHRGGRLDRAAAAGKRGQRRRTSCTPSPARPRFSSRPATNSARST